MFLRKLSNNEPRTIKTQPKLHAALHRHTAKCTSHGNRVSDKRLFCFNLRITELIIFIGIIGVISVLRFIRTVSDIRAGLREAGHVLGGVLWSRGL